MKYMLTTIAAAMAAFTVTAADEKAPKTERTMEVKRCQAILDNGKQCEHRADDETDFCWRHRGFIKACKETADGTSDGAVKSWNATKNWSTNTWNSTKSGAKDAWNATKGAIDGARVGMVELLGGKDAKGDGAKEKDAKEKKSE